MAQQNIQTYMIVWDVNLKILNKANCVDIFLPLFCLTSAETKHKYWIRIATYKDVFDIRTNLSKLKEFKRCTTFLINPTTKKVLHVYKGLEKFSWNNQEWSEEMQFVFELEMQCDTSTVQPIIWKRFTTEIKPPINSCELLNLESETAIHTVLSSQGESCKVDRYCTGSSEHNVTVIPEKPSKHWNLLISVITQENHFLERYYFQTASTGWKGRCFEDFKRFVIFELNELSISLKDMTELDIAAMTSVIMAHLSPANDKQEKQQVNTSSSLLEYFNKMIICDITIHVQDQQIRAHKIALADKSTIWHDLFVQNETLSMIHITDFDYETIKQLIEYIYTGVMKQATDQLFIAANKYGVDGLKKLCEEQLIDTIDIKSAVNLLVMADRYNAVALYDKVMEFIVENRAAFKDLEEAKAMFLIYPELTFKLASKVF